MWYTVCLLNFLFLWSNSEQIQSKFRANSDQIQSKFREHAADTPFSYGAHPGPWTCFSRTADIVPFILAAVFPTLFYSDCINSKDIKRLWPLRKKISPPFKAEFTLLPSRSSTMLSGRGTFGENMPPLQPWGSRHFFSGHKGSPCLTILTLWAKGLGMFHNDW